MVRTPPRARMFACIEWAAHARRTRRFEILSLGARIVSKRAVHDGEVCPCMQVEASGEACGDDDMCGKVGCGQWGTRVAGVE